MGRPSVKPSRVRAAIELAEGYVRLPFRSPFLKVLGAVYVRENGSGRSFAVRILPRHLNAARFAHGGFLVTVADAAMSWAPAKGAPVPRITVSLNSDFVGAAREGEWLEVDVDLQRDGRTLVFVNANLRVGDRAVAHASCVLRTRR